MLKNWGFDIDHLDVYIAFYNCPDCFNVQITILKKVAKLSNNYALIADEIGQGLYGELDYRHEAANAAEFALAHKHVPWLYVPKTLSHMTRRKLLVMEWLNGDRPFDLQCVAEGLPYENGTLPSQEVQQEARRRLLNMVCILSPTYLRSNELGCRSHIFFDTRDGISLLVFQQNILGGLLSKSIDILK